MLNLDALKGKKCKCHAEGCIYSINYFTQTQFSRTIELLTLLQNAIFRLKFNYFKLATFDACHQKTES